MAVEVDRFIICASIGLFSSLLIFTLVSCPSTTGGNPPTAAFSLDPEAGDADLTVQFTDQSSGSVSSWDWDFGDGSDHSTQQNPQHTYTRAGYYDVTLTVSGAYGSDQLKKEDCIVTYGIAISADATHVLKGESVSFTDLSVCPPGDEYDNWSWDFGDGGASTEQNPTHSYASYEFFDVVLTVDGPYKPGSSAPLEINVNPIADFSVTPSSGSARLEVDFVDLSSIDVTSWSWNFGDGDTFSGQNPPTHRYDFVGNYPVTLDVDTGDGGFDSVTKTVVAEWMDPIETALYMDDEDPAPKPIDVICADLDDEGSENDIVATAGDQKDVYIWLDGQVGVGSPQRIGEMDEYPSSLAVGKINNDADIDIVGACTDGEIYYWENVNGQGGSWSSRQTVRSVSSYPVYSVAATDVDGDTDVDIVAAVEKGGDEVVWYENNGSGEGWTEHGIVSSFPGSRSVICADISGNGSPLDVVSYSLVSGTSYEISWFENNGSGGGWTKTTIFTYSISPLSISLDAADMDGDGDQDVVAGFYGTSSVTWYENPNSGDPWTDHDVGYANGVFDVHAADLDGDGYFDVLAAGFLGDGVIWWENADINGTTWVEHEVEADYSTATAVYSGDINGDGALDVLGTSAATRRVSWWKIRN